MRERAGKLAEHCYTQKMRQLVPLTRGFQFCLLPLTYVNDRGQDT